MNQVTVITADQKFPESQTREGIETDDRILKYGTPWPLSEDFYICNYIQSLILLDRMGKALLKNHRGRRITETEFRRVCLWLDLNSSRLGAFNDVSRQERGELVWTNLDADPDNITGVEKTAITFPAKNTPTRKRTASQ